MEFEASEDEIGLNAVVCLSALPEVSMRRIVSVALAALIAVSVAVMLCVGTWTGHHLWSKSEPDANIRRSVANIRPDQVAAVRLDILPDMLVVTSTSSTPKGLTLQPGFRYATKRNPKAVAALLKGLKRATIPRTYHMDRICSVEIELRDGRTIGPFIFGNHRFEDCISPDFIKGLKLAGVRSLPHK